MGDVAFVAVCLVTILAVSKSIAILAHFTLHFDLLATWHLPFLVHLLLLVVLVIKAGVWIVELLRDHAVMVRYIFHNRFRRSLIGDTFRSLVN